MGAEHEKDEESIYHAAAAQPAAERAAYLREACRDDPALRARVETLLQSREEAGDFLAAPVLGPDLTLDEPAVSEGPGSVIGRYKLLERIGEGGMAVVYMAEQEQPLRRRVALKIIKLGMDTKQVIARFEAERQALALMDHPCIARVLDAGATETGRPYFVMELVTGVSITEYCDKSSLSTKDRLLLFLQVCQAVQHAHTKGIIHRDIKPSNVMVTHRDGRPIPKVIDFGIAKAINQKLTEKTLFTRYAHLIGTPAYMSPEQAELSDLDIDTRSDIYSLGVLLYELLTGTTPFSEEELRKAGYIEMQRVIREQEPVKPSTRIKTALRRASVLPAGKTSWRGRLALACRGHPPIESGAGSARATSWHRHLADASWAGSPCHKEQGQDALATKSTGETPVVLMGGMPMLREVRGDLDWIVMKTLEKDRTRRYETASGLAEDLRRHLEHEPVLARGPSTTYRLHKFLRRYRSQVLAALVMVTVSAAAAVLLSLWNRDRFRLAETKDKDILSQARGQYATGERDAALETIQPILASRHVGPEAQLLQVGILVDNHQSEEAVKILEGLLKERAEIAGAAHSLLARILWENEPLQGQKREEIEEHRRQARALLPETAEAYYLHAIIAATIKEQLAALDKALWFESDHYESLRLRAFIHYASRKYEKMTDDAAGMIVLRQGDPMGYSLNAIAWRELGHYEKAIADFDAAIRLTPTEDPQYLDLVAQRLETQLRMGAYEQVVTDGRAYLSQSRAQDLSHVQHCIFFALTGLGDYDKATDLFRQMIGSSHESRGLFRAKCQRYIDATLRAGRSWHPSDPAPTGAAFLPLLEAEEIYQALSAKAKPIDADGFNTHWSPDGKKLAYSLGVRGASGVAIYDLARKETELLILAARDPKWSPDGQYIAFIRDRLFLQIPELMTASFQERLNREIWVMKSDGTEPRRLAHGANWPSWQKDSTCVYFAWRNTLESIPIDGRQAEPNSITPCPPGFHSVSPDNRYLAYLDYDGRLKVKDLALQAVVAQWPVPFHAWGGPGWSPTSGELCLGSDAAAHEKPGLWFYRLGHEEPVKTLDGSIMNGAWAPDGTKLAFDWGRGIWVADLNPKVSASEALGPGRTADEYLQEMVAFHTRRINADPMDAYAYFGRADCYDRLHDRAGANADMRRWSAAASGRSPSGLDAPPARADFTFGEPAKLDVATRFFPTCNCIVDCFSSDGLEMFVESDLAGGQGAFDFWVLKRASPQDDWGPPENLGPAVNSASFEYCSSITGDGLELFFYSFRPGGHGYGDLYVTRRATRTSPWGPAANPGPNLNSSYDEAGPSVSSDGLELYFSSRRPGGYGLYDIYVSKRATTNDSWGDPVNCGPAVNSPFHEMYPCVSPDGLLLFLGEAPYIGPRRPGGFGNGDLWMTRRASRTAPWEPAVNLGPKVNSSEDECKPCLAPDGSALYCAWDWPDRTCIPWKAPIKHIVKLDDTVQGKEE